MSRLKLTQKEFSFFDRLNPDLASHVGNMRLRAMIGEKRNRRIKRDARKGYVGFCSVADQEDA
jgi:hypothetical protein